MVRQFDVEFTTKRRFVGGIIDILLQMLIEAKRAKQTIGDLLLFKEEVENHEISYHKLVDIHETSTYEDLKKLASAILILRRKAIHERNNTTPQKRKRDDVEDLSRVHRRCLFDEDRQLIQML